MVLNIGIKTYLITWSDSGSINAATRLKGDEFKKYIGSTESNNFDLL